VDRRHNAILKIDSVVKNPHLNTSSLACSLQVHYPKRWRTSRRTQTPYTEGLSLAFLDLQVFRFTQRWRWEFRSCGMWRCVTG